jgi:hypothetical protein
MSTLQATNLKHASSASNNIVLDSSGNASVANDLKFNSGYGSSATAYGCRAWVNFNGTGTVAIRASGNVTSITDLGVGIFKVNLTTALPDASYAISGFCENNASDRNNLVACTNTSDSASVTAMAAGSFCFKTMTSAATAVDQASTTVAVFR